MAEKRDTLRKWIYATRPHTLGASVAPMLILLGALLIPPGFGNRVVPFLLALFVAVFAQISSNLANDYFDYVGQKDTEERVGFERLLTTGAVTPRQMLTALIVTSALTALAGILFAYLQGWWVLGVGVVVLLAMVGYSAGPFPLSHHGLGDIAVVLFYGLVPVLVPYFALIGTPPLSLFLYALGIGIWEANILVCNNYRDYEEDVRSGKRTLVVRLGEKSGPWLYGLNSLLSFVCFAAGFVCSSVPSLQYIWLAVISVIFGSMTRKVFIKKGASLNRMLKATNLVALFIGLSLLVFYLIEKLV